ncbi:Coenzyme F420-reducing hydrogenase, beta subunit [Butyrivibrio sp. ob235]|uniref:Coenzyme F420 hydrogenase/dehydrogenase, beta subunit C-terminal domain n=1 Tax=Butyrivibrio sp. ob235 TaxID=1761780 RepID=UPI0008B5F1D4|nr:Coenzyme F420 hydrogenase/dehydrogenase, beta subunit C-terminal domain [Butyrivibrio sp. ob235]SEL72675.1 Coenzyme F420-reducing hydrogenase, beta subunit [Butyrivibrio sp. ob235]
MTEKEKIVLFESKEKCCGCGACMNVCPKHAISMETDEYGFVYPNIDYSKCVGCGLCKKSCGFQNLPQLYVPQKVYAATSRDKTALKISASGGAFEAIARKVLSDGGCVYGSAMDKKNRGMLIHHVEINNIDELYKLQGSKYVQSSIGNIYRTVKQKLTSGQKVLFSGTPCQIAGLKKYILNEYDNLYTVEIICHGVPNNKLFNDFISYEEQKLGGDISEFYFRDKTKGQGYTTKTVYTKDEKKIIKTSVGELKAYIRLFSKGLTLRDSCYCCPFAQSHRCADITVGDYWGFHVEHPEVKGLEMSNRLGVSCVLCNTERGKELISDCENMFYLVDSSYEKVARHNKQMNGPCIKSDMRRIVLNTYKEGGYQALEKLYWAKWKRDKVKYFISGIMPKSLKTSIKSILSKKGKNLGL